MHWMWWPWAYWLTVGLLVLLGGLTLVSARLAARDPHAELTGVVANTAGIVGLFGGLNGAWIVVESLLNIKKIGLVLLWWLSTFVAGVVLVGVGFVCVRALFVSPPALDRASAEGAEDPPRADLRPLLGCACLMLAIWLVVHRLVLMPRGLTF